MHITGNQFLDHVSMHDRDGSCVLSLSNFPLPRGVCRGRVGDIWSGWRGLVLFSSFRLHFRLRGFATTGPLEEHFGEHIARDADRGQPG